MRIILVVLLLSFVLPLRATAAPIDSLLTELNQTLAHKNGYDQQRWRRIKALTADFASHKADDSTKFRLGLRVYDEYKAFKYDSAFVYCQKVKQLAERLNSPEKVELAKLRLAFILLSAGLFKETFETLEAIKPNQLRATDKLDFYFTKARAYNDLAYFNQDEFYRPLYLTKLLACTDSALQFCWPGSYECLSVQAFITQRTGNLTQGVAVYRQIRQLPALTQH